MINIRILKNYLRDFLRLALGKYNYTKLRFYFEHGYCLNLEKPISWNEKIQFRKLVDDPKQFSKYVDKYTVRDFVAKTIGSEYLIPLIAKFDYITVEDLESLPNSFVIKTSNGGGGENVKIVYNKNDEDLKVICDVFNEYLEIKIGHKIDEYFYDIEKPCILVETLILDEFGNLPSDYKCHSFNGNNANILVQVDTGRFIDHRRSFYNESLVKQDFSIQPKYQDIDSYIFPENFDFLLEKVRVLSSAFEYVRVDMYLVKGKIYFGEMTFCHGSGWEPVSPRKYDFILGSYWDL